MLDRIARVSSIKPGAAAVAVLALVVVLALPARIGLGEDSAKSAAAVGPLDGMRFVGDFGPEGEPADFTDAMSFGDGQFWSKNCVPCGFPPGDYWVRFAGDDIHFRGILESPERGRFVYEGVVSNGQLSARINWRQERWYWTIDRDFWFEGTLQQPEEPVSAGQAASLAANADPDPIDCDPAS